jgi:hypothetical protein
MNDLHRSCAGDDYADALARDLNFTALYLYDNSGLHISTNGRTPRLSLPPSRVNPFFGIPLPARRRFVIAPLHPTQLTFFTRRPMISTGCIIQTSAVNFPARSALPIHAEKQQLD